MHERSLMHDSSYKYIVWIRSDAFADIIMKLGVGEIPTYHQQVVANIQQNTR